MHSYQRNLLPCFRLQKQTNVRRFATLPPSYHTIITAAGLPFARSFSSCVIRSDQPPAGCREEIEIMEMPSAMLSISYHITTSFCSCDESCWRGGKASFLAACFFHITHCRTSRHTVADADGLFCCRWIRKRNRRISLLVVLFEKLFSTRSKIGKHSGDFALFLYTGMLPQIGIGTPSWRGGGSLCDSQIAE